MNIPDTEGMEEKMNSMMRAFTPHTPETEWEKEAEALGLLQKRVDDIKEQIDENLRLTSHVPYITTPDTEEKHVAYSPEVNQIRPILVKYFNEYPADLLADLSVLLTSRDTYWKERVRKQALRLYDDFYHHGKNDDGSTTYITEKDFDQILQALDNLN